MPMRGELATERRCATVSYQSPSPAWLCFFAQAAHIMVSLPRHEQLTHRQTAAPLPPHSVQSRGLPAFLATSSTPSGLAPSAPHADAISTFSSVIVP